MDTTKIVSLVKERLGIKSTVRDTYLAAIINGVIKELEMDYAKESGLELDDKMRKAEMIAAIKGAMGWM